MILVMVLCYAALGSIPLWSATAKLLLGREVGVRVSRVIIGEASLRARLLAGLLAGIFFAVPGLLIISCVWSHIPERERAPERLPLWSVLAVLISVYMYAFLGLVYESLHPRLVYSHEPPTRVFVYATSLAIPLAILALISALTVLAAEILLRRVLHGVRQRRPRAASSGAPQAG